MFERIFVPLDGSTRAEQAIPVAARLARASGGTVMFVAVVDMGANSVAAVAPVSRETFDRQLEDVQAYLTSIAARADLAGLPTESDVARGAVAETLLAEASAKRADLVVMTGHGRTGFLRWALGSVAEQLARHTPMPVLILREPIPEALTPSSPGQGAQPLRVLVPLDGSPLAESALAPAAHLLEALAPPADRMLQLTRVVSEFPGGEQTLLGSLMASVAWQEAQRYLLATAERLQTGELVQPQALVTWCLTEDIDAATGVVDVAETGMNLEGTSPPGGCDLIALASQGCHDPQRWALGSVAERVVLGTRLPVLIVRTGEPTSRAPHHEMLDAGDRSI